MGVVFPLVGILEHHGEEMATGIGRLESGCLAAEELCQLWAKETFVSFSTKL